MLSLSNFSFLSNILQSNRVLNEVLVTLNRSQNTIVIEEKDLLAWLAKETCVSDPRNGTSAEFTHSPTREDCAV